MVCHDYRRRGHMMERVLVFGHNGFTGRYFLDHAVKNGFSSRYEIWGVDRSGQRGHKALAGEYSLDCEDAAAIHALVRDLAPSYAVNLIGLFGNRTLEEFVRVNVLVSKNILDAFIETDTVAKKVLLIGSAAEYGVNCENPIPETAIPHPANDHGLSKFIQTCLALGYFKTYEFPVVIARTFNIIGEGSSTELAIGRFERQIKDAGDGGKILVGDLSHRRDYLDAKEVVQYYWRLLEAGKPGEIYNVCSGFSVAIGDVLDEMIKASGKRLFIERDVAFKKIGDISDIYGDCGKLKALMGGMATR